MSHPKVLSQTEITGCISDELCSKIHLLYEWLVIHKNPKSDLRLSELVGEMIETGYEEILKERHIKFEVRDAGDV